MARVSEREGKGRTGSARIAPACCRTPIVVSRKGSKPGPTAIATSPKQLRMTGLTLRWSTLLWRSARRTSMNPWQYGRLASPSARQMSPIRPTAIEHNWYSSCELRALMRNGRNACRYGWNCCSSAAVSAPMQRNASSRIGDCFPAVWISWSRSVIIRSASGWISLLSRRVMLCRATGACQRVSPAAEPTLSGWRTVSTPQMLTWSSL